MLSTFLKSLLLATVCLEGSCNQLKKIQMNHRSSKISNDGLRYLSGLSNESYTNEVLSHILIPRVVGTPGHKKVFDYLNKELRDLTWNVEIDEFEDNTPMGKLTFKNIIATLNPAADRFLVLACHYDSKYFEDVVFVGATDSAVPCAMMLNLIKVMDKELKSVKLNNLSLKLIFFDGEEAFEEWGPKDSIYGARHLATTYHNTRTTSGLSGEEVTDLQKIDIMVLLDLIGHKETRFFSTIDSTENWFLQLCQTENTLKKLGLLQNTNREYFVRRRYHANIEDDHIPFLRKDVPILHLISIPFPDEWHTARDNASIIDYTTVENINKILRVFVAEYLNVEIEDTGHEDIPDKEL